MSRSNETVLIRRIIRGKAWWLGPDANHLTTKLKRASRVPRDKAERFIAIYRESGIPNLNIEIVPLAKAEG